MSNYQYGVFYEGRDLGWVGYDSFEEARYELESTDEKYEPAWLARRELGPIEPLRNI